MFLRLVTGVIREPKSILRHSHTTLLRKSKKISLSKLVWLTLIPIVFLKLSHLGRGASLSDASLYSTPVDQVNLSVAFDMEDHRPVLSGFSSSFGIGDINSPFPSITPAQDRGRCIFPSPENRLGLVLTDDPASTYYTHVRARTQRR